MKRILLISSFLVGCILCMAQTENKRGFALGAGAGCSNDGMIVSEIFSLVSFKTKRVPVKAKFGFNYNPFNAQFRGIKELKTDWRNFLLGTMCWGIIWLSIRMTIVKEKLVLDCFYMNMGIHTRVESQAIYIFSNMVLQAPNIRDQRKMMLIDEEHIILGYDNEWDHGINRVRFWEFGLGNMLWPLIWLWNR